MLKGGLCSGMEDVKVMRYSGQMTIGEDDAVLMNGVQVIIFLDITLTYLLSLSYQI